METAPKELPADRSFLIDLYAAAARHYMQESGATVHDFAAVVVKNQANGALNPLAQYGGSLTVEEVLAAREIVWPFTLPMCSPVTDGAAAAVLCARGNGGEVEVRASVLRCADFSDASQSVTARAAEAAYEQAGLGPPDLDLAEVHDAAASAELSIYEQLGLVARGGGLELIRNGATRLDGSLPVNPSAGLAQIVEIVQQLRCRPAGARWKVRGSA